MKIGVNQKASEWILKQPWLSQFVDNCVAIKTPPDMILAYLLGTESYSTIFSAFTWSHTPEGGDFWGKIDDEIEDVSEEEDWGEFDTTIEI